MKNIFYSVYLSTLILFFTSCSSKSPEVVETDAPKVVHAYLLGKLMRSEHVSEKLRQAGFEVVGTYTVSTKYKLQTVIYTDAKLKEMANRPGRGFMGLGRVLIDGKNSQISIANPEYFGKAFMQDTAKYAELKALKDRLTSVFSGLKPSSDRLAYKSLGDYHFMVAMPYYQDSIIIGEGSTDELLAKLKSYQDGKFYLFSIQLAPEKYLVGFDLSRSVGRFPEKIGIQNSGLLPYTILIENKQARILAPKYYLAVSYPQLTMPQFMRIPSVPNAIERELSFPFQ